MVKMFVRTGKGKKSKVVRREIKNKKNYKMIGKYGKFGLYVRVQGKVEKKVRKVVRRVVKKAKKSLGLRNTREEAIAKIRGIGRLIESDKNLERRLFEKPSRYSKVSRKFISNKVNPMRVVLTDGKSYKSFAQLDQDKHKIYRQVILKNLKTEKMIDKIYRNRRTLLKDGMVIKIRCFGRDGYGKLKGIKYLGTFEATGLLIEEARFMERVVVGFSGYLADLTTSLDVITRERGGRGVKMIENNTTGTNVSVVGVQLEFWRMC